MTIGTTFCSQMFFAKIRLVAFFVSLSKRFYFVRMIRRLLFLIITFAASATYLHAQWNAWDWQKMNLPAPYDQGYYLGIYFLPTNSNVGWVCGYNGAVLRTRDGGKTWRGSVVSNAPQLESIIFLNDNVGYCSGTNQFSPGAGGVYKSTDGGASWFEITPLVFVGGQLQRASVWGCNFYNERVGLVVGGGCSGEMQMFFRTDDGGASWSLYTSSYPNSGLSHPRMQDPNGKCYASSSGAIWRSDDGGRTWSVVSSTGPAYWQENLQIRNNSICVATAGTSCIGGTDAAGDVRFSRDMGRTWTTTRIGQAMFGTYLLNDSTGWAAGFAQSVYRTSDYGQTWTPYRCGLEAGSNFDDIFFINDTLGYVVGDGIYKTVKPQSAPPITVSGDTVFCEGGSVTLTAAPGYTVYRWSNGENTQSIKATRSGTYYVSMRKGSDCPLISNNVRVTVLPAPRPLARSSRANNHLCFNDSTELSIQGIFRTVKWSTGDTTQKIVVRKAGTYAVEVSDANGCVGKDSVVITGGVKISPRLSRVARVSVCEGDSLVLSAEEGYAKYDWSNAEQSASVVIKESGVYKVRVTDSYGCTGESDSVVVRFDPNPLQIAGLPGGKLVIDTTRPHVLRCDTLRLRNVGPDTLVISVVRLLRNIEFSVPQSQLNVLIPSGEERTIAVCYSPSALHTQRDTIVVGDYCNRVVIVESAGAPDDYDARSRCDVPLNGITRTIATTGLYIYPAYPQPAADAVTLRVKSSAGRVESIQAYDLLGNAYTMGVRSLRETGHSGNFQDMEVVVQTSELPDGLYSLVVHTASHSAATTLQVIK